jgi:hypothetical protein
LAEAAQAELVEAAERITAEAAAVPAGTDRLFLVNQMAEETH